MRTKDSLICQYFLGRGYVSPIS